MSEVESKVVDVPNLNLFVENLGKDEKPESPKVPSRKDVQKKAKYSVTEEDREVVLECAAIIGQVDFDPENYSQDYLDQLARELKFIRKSQDILKGRHEAIRDLVFAAIDYSKQGDNPEQQPGELVSDAESYKLVRNIRGGKVQPNWYLLKDHIDTSIWKYIIDKVETTVRKYNHKDLVVEENVTVQEVINEDRLKDAIETGHISLEILKKAVSVSAITQVFSPSDI